MVKSIYTIYLSCSFAEPHYTNLGCWRDTSNRAIPTLEGIASNLDGKYWTRQNALEKCYQAAKQRGHEVFAVQNGGWCASSPIALNTYKKYGTTNTCKPDGEGGPWGNQVYRIPSGKYRLCYPRSMNSPKIVSMLETLHMVLKTGS